MSDKEQPRESLISKISKLKIDDQQSDSPQMRPKPVVTAEPTPPPVPAASPKPKQGSGLSLTVRAQQIKQQLHKGTIAIFIAIFFLLMGYMQIRSFNNRTVELENKFDKLVEQFDKFQKAAVLKEDDKKMRKQIMAELRDLEINNKVAASLVRVMMNMSAYRSALNAQTDDAVILLEYLLEKNPDDKNLRKRLYDFYFLQGQRFRSQGQKKQAYMKFNAAKNLNVQLAEQDRSVLEQIIKSLEN